MCGVKILGGGTMQDLGNRKQIVSLEKKGMMVTAEQTQLGALQQILLNVGPCLRVTSFNHL